MTSHATLSVAALASGPKRPIPVSEQRARVSGSFGTTRGRSFARGASTPLEVRERVTRRRDERPEPPGHSVRMMVV